MRGVLAKTRKTSYNWPLRHNTHALIFVGKFSLAQRWTGRLLAGKSCLQITTRFRFLGLPSILRLLSFICFFAQVQWAWSKLPPPAYLWSHAQTTPSISFFPFFSGSSWTFPGEHCFFIILRQISAFVIWEDSPILIKKVFKILPLRQIATWRSNFETRPCWSALATGNIHMKTSQEQK